MRQEPKVSFDGVVTAPRRMSFNIPTGVGKAIVIAKALRTDAARQQLAGKRIVVLTSRKVVAQQLQDRVGPTVQLEYQDASVLPMLNNVGCVIVMDVWPSRMTDIVKHIRDVPFQLIETPSEDV